MSNLFSELRLTLIFGMAECLSRAGTFGVCDLTLPALVNEP
jgi:hypothetical protein